MGKISDFYTNGKTTITKTIDGVQHTFTCTKTLNELFTDPVDDFDNSICLSFCSNNERVNTARRYYNSNSTNNFNVAWANIIDTRYRAYYKENITGEPVEFIGSSLIWSDTNKVIPDDIMLSLKDLTDGYGNSITTSLFKNYRFLLDANNNGLNDIFVVWSQSNGECADAYRTNGYYGKITPSVRIIKNLMNTTRENMINGSVCNVGLVLFIKYKDQLYITTPSALYPYLNCWSYDPDYRLDNFNEFTAAISRSTGADKTWCGAFTDTDNKMYLDMLGNFDLPTTPTEFPFTSDIAYVCGLKRYISTSSRRSCQWMLNGDLTKYNENMFGLKWITSTEYDTPQSLYDNMKLPYMDEYADIDCEKWVTGLDAIKISDSKNVDMDYDKTPDITPPSKRDNTDKIDKMNSNSVMSIYGRIKYYKMTSTELAGMLSEIEELDDDKAMNGFVSCYHVPMLTDNICEYSAGINIRVAGHTLTQTADHIVGNKTYTIASFSVPAHHNNAYDTLTKYYLYTPFTDVIPLDYKCYNRNITVELHPSIQDITASLTVKCDGAIIHKQTVSLGSSLSIAVENNAEKQQALISACSKYTASAMGTLAGFMTGNIPAIAGGSLGVISSTANVMNALNRNYIHSYGTNTGASIGLLPSGVYLIEHIVKLDEPANFGATVGYLTNKKMELSANMGYTKMDKPRIECGLTAPEMTELISMLENGVIL